MSYPAFLLYSAWALSAAAIWMLAMAPLPAGAPEWIASTRAVCFGTRADGLPELHGWVGMASPVAMLLALLVVLGRELREEVGRLWQGSVGRTGVVLLAALPLALMLWIGWRVAQARPVELAAEVTEMPADYPRLDLPVPDFRLVDQYGHEVTREDLRGRVTLLAFVYAHCQTVCPELVQTMRSTPAAAGRWYVTLDPWRDTPASLPQLAMRWELERGSRLLSGDPESVGRLLDALQVPRDRSATDGQISHPALVLLIDRSARVAYAFTDPDPAWLEEAVRRLP